MDRKQLASLRICAQKLTPQSQKKLEEKCIGQCPMNQQKLQAAFFIKKKWPKNTKIRIGFLGDGSSIPRTPISDLKSPTSKLDPLQEKTKGMSVIDAIKMVVNERLIPLVNLDIKFVDDPREANIRIGFDPNGGSWSYLGTDCLNVPYPEPNINLGWFDIPVVLHEILGHCCGPMIHEHQSPFGEPIQWNRERVLDWAKTTQGWDTQTTETNILNKYDVTELNGSEFDPASIMLYFFPAYLTMNNKGTNQNLRLSGDDVIWLYNNYPRDDITPAEFYMRVYGEDISASVDASRKEARKQLFGSTGLPIKIFIGIALAIIAIGAIFLIRNRNVRYRVRFA